ncbi:unnamed protein product [Arabis nemorensis]|uniref:Uncharacterized protein n=1 Tax=Arabis nemorensis TaxID=586526 RepID=A0A565B2E7_9BRAS|nr:unnamed protein product [Arabis nemorensis]
MDAKSFHFSQAINNLLQCSLLSLGGKVKDAHKKSSLLVPHPNKKSLVGDLNSRTGIFWSFVSI